MKTAVKLVNLSMLLLCFAASSYAEEELESAQMARVPPQETQLSFKQYEHKLLRTEHKLVSIVEGKHQQHQKDSITAEQ